MWLLINNRQRNHMTSHFSREIWVDMLLFHTFQQGGISSLRLCEHARSPREKTLLWEDFLCWNRSCLDTRQNIRSRVPVSCRIHGSSGKDRTILLARPNRFCFIQLTRRANDVINSLLKLLRFSIATLCDFLKVLAPQFLKIYGPSRAFSRAFALGASYASLLHYRIGSYFTARGGDWLVSCVG